MSILYLVSTLLFTPFIVNPVYFIAYSMAVPIYLAPI